MNEDKIREVIEQADPGGKIPPAMIEELVNSIKSSKALDPAPGKAGMIYDSLKDQLSRETDWRRKASLAARIISLGLES